MSDLLVTGTENDVSLSERARGVPQLRVRVVEQEYHAPLSRVQIADGGRLGRVVRDGRQSGRDHSRSEADVHVPEIRLQRDVFCPRRDRTRTGLRVQAERPVSGVRMPMVGHLRAVARARGSRAP